MTSPVKNKEKSKTISNVRITELSKKKAVYLLAIFRILETVQGEKQKAEYGLSVMAVT